ncbi:MAG: 16S rRNA (cytidine(1402)-2'-O)-methyltransferase [Candidatus Eisenbacteria bacterium]|uniref:Ribosomal RNA small subunit methyltransferase I n=1 Tax=Eiseniibacteriota bacterium TaxID=2212470 RepID=A0A956SBD4_UNCEI|nr:16S rRNA (cytidine(1402)-2'-O)-methyltransferase [Candidatus Eisenbacteria bacterium]MCB9462301.1 16S rRNA (cytidine(1402)-2'-O)-methyltransferase [Candidatus Eisenbacteria bacterium]
MTSARLYLVPTPIGNLEDMTYRAVRVLREVDWIAAEDTRRARVLLQAYDVSTRPISHHAHNEHRESSRLVERLLAGESGALITDAGMPGVSDPGFFLAREARAAGISVEVLPGASAVLTALVASGFPPEPFLFLGYVPNSSGRRVRFLQEVGDEPRTVVFFEVPHRIHRTLQTAAELWEDRQVALARELTKKFEEIVRGPASEILGSLPSTVKGEIVVVVAPKARSERKKRDSAQE